MGVINNRHKQTKLKDDEVIVMYKCGSYGQIVGIYECVKDIVSEERFFNKRLSFTTIYNCLYGIQKTTKSLKHQCIVKLVIKKRTEVINEIQIQTTSSPIKTSAESI